MSISYQPKQSQVYAAQLSSQELVLKLSDDQIVSVSGSDAIINVGQPIDSVQCALFIDDSAATCAPVVVSKQTVSGNEVTLTLSAPLAANDAIILKFKL